MNKAKQTETEKSDREFLFKNGFCPKCNFRHEIYGCNIEAGICNWKPVSMLSLEPRLEDFET